MDSACFIANGRDGGGHLSLLLTEAFKAKNIVTIFCQEYNFPWCLAKEQDSLCLSLERIGRGRADGGICSQARRALRSEPNLPGAWLSEQEKHELLHLCLSFSGGLTVISHQDLGCQVSQSVLWLSRATLLFQRHLWREAHSIPQDTSSPSSLTAG